MTNKIENYGCVKFELDIKRLRLPYKVTSNCPRCNKEHTIDLNDRYLSYPMVKEISNIHFACEDDNHYEEWSVEVILNISLELARKQ